MLDLVKEYGPIVGVLLVFIGWQAHWINKLLDRHEKAYSGEIERMHEREKLLLGKLLGEQPTSQDIPDIEHILSRHRELKEGNE
jgi:hypothetical protein